MVFAYFSSGRGNRVIEPLYPMGIYILVLDLGEMIVSMYY